MEMEAKLCCFLLALQIVVVGLVSATSRTFAPNDGARVYQPGQVTTKSSSPAIVESNLGSKQKKGSGREGEGRVNEEEEEAYSRGLSRIGSSPPSCEHKCYGCTPCEAIQVPTTSKTHSHLGVNYANYEPEGWKCKCGPSFYSP